MPFFKKFIWESVEAFPIIVFYFFLRIMPVSLASGFMGFIARLLGPLLPVSRLGLKNLKQAFPEYSFNQHKKIMKDAWENLGRVVGEFPHVQKLSRNKKYMTVSNEECIEHIKNDGIAGIFFSAHLANWELPHLIVNQHQLPLWLISRPPNNSITKAFLKMVREDDLTRLLLKGSEGSKKLIKILMQHQHAGILIDQRLSEGERVEFFNELALTATGPAKLAHKFNIPLVPVQVERKKGCHFHVTFHPPLALGQNPLETTQRMNIVLEEWIKKNPGQWLWFHNRWRI